MKSASSYWQTRKAHEKAMAKLRAEGLAKRFAASVERNAVATLLPGASVCELPYDLRCLPVAIHLPNGARILCNYLGNV